MQASPRACPPPPYWHNASSFDSFGIHFESFLGSHFAVSLAISPFSNASKSSACAGVTKVTAAPATNGARLVRKSLLLPSDVEWETGVNAQNWVVKKMRIPCTQMNNEEILCRSRESSLKIIHRKGSLLIKPYQMLPFHRRPVDSLWPQIDLKVQLSLPNRVPNLTNLPTNLTYQQPGWQGPRRRRRRQQGGRRGRRYASW